MALVLDTDVVSYIFKKDTRAAAYQQHLINAPLFISFMTLAELRRWQLQSTWGAYKTAEFEAFLDGFGVIFCDIALCSIWARITHECNAVGKSISTSDAWVASVAVMFDVPLLTHNKKHFESIEDLTLL